MSMNNENLGDVMRRDGSKEYVDITAEHQEPQNFRYTEEQKARMVQEMMASQEPVKQQQEEDQVNVVNQPRPSGGMRMLTPEELAQLAGGQQITETPIDVEAELEEKQNEKVRRLTEEPQNRMASMFEEAMKSEEERVERLDNTLDDDERRAELFKGTEMERKSKTVNYESSYESNANDAEEKPTANTSVKREIPRSAEEINFDEFAPSYDDDEEEEEPKAENKQNEARPNINDSEEEYAEYIRNLETIQYASAEDEPSVVATVKDRPNVTPVSSGRLNKTKNMQDSSFLSAVNKFKKDSFRTVSVPLVNSGFTVDIVGSGAVDLTLLYSVADSNISSADYELEKMKTVMRNVVGTHPKVGKDNLRNMIHYIDYQLMAYAHVAATLKDIETIQTCPECGNDYHIVCKSSDLILNMDELRERMNAIKNTDNINDYSLMMKDQEFTTTDGFMVQLGHPSYADYIQYLTELKSMNESMNQVELTMLSRVVESLPFIRSVTMPNGVHTSSLYQRFIALGLLTEKDLRDLQAEITKMSEAIIMPQFGIKRVTCPCCGKVNTNIAFNNLDDLLFFHIMVTRLLNQTDLKSTNG